MDPTIINTIITAATTLLVSIGTWQITTKQARKKDAEEMKASLTKLIEQYRDELHNRMEDLQTDVNNIQASVTQVNGTVQQQIAIIELKIDTLSERVEKHNGVIERTYKLERDVEVQEEKIRVANHRIEDLEAKK